MAGLPKPWRGGRGWRRIGWYPLCTLLFVVTQLRSVYMACDMAALYTTYMDSCSAGSDFGVNSSDFMRELAFDCSLQAPGNTGLLNVFNSDDNLQPALLASAASLEASSRASASPPPHWNVSVAFNAGYMPSAVVAELLSRGGSLTDAFFLPSYVMGQCVNLSLASPLDSLLFTNLSLEWYGISPYLRSIATLYNGSTYAVPVSGAHLSTYLMYRRDLFQQYGLGPLPPTWEGLAEMVGRLAAQGWRGPGRDGSAPAAPGGGGDPSSSSSSSSSSSPPYWPFCWNMNPEFGTRQIYSIFSAKVQAMGVRSGTVADPDSGFIMLNSVAMDQAMALFMKLSSYGPQLVLSGGPHPAFLNGTCLITVGTFPDFKAYTMLPGSQVRGVLEVSQLPGSAEVLDRQSKQMAACTRLRCPYAVAETMPDGSSQLVNRAPFVGGTYLAMLRGGGPRAVRRALMDLVVGVARPDVSWQLLLQPNSSMSPYRLEHTDPNYLGRWLEAGYPVSPTATILQIAQRMLTSPNLVPILVVNGAQDVQFVLLQATRQLLAGGQAQQILAGVEAAIRSVVVRTYGSYSAFLAAYQATLLYTGHNDTTPSGPTAPSNAPGSASALSKQSIVIISCVVGLAALLTCLVLFEVKNKLHNKDLLGRVKPPGAGPDTTILVAKVQDFDDLWELLVEAASDRALQLFRRLVDRLLRRYSGYQMSSEEDTVLAAFHNPRDAAHFAMDLQRSLLHLPWPKQVLDLAPFKALHLRPLVVDERKAGSQASSLSRPGLSFFKTGLISRSTTSEEEDKLFSLGAAATCAASFGEQCACSWALDDGLSPTAELVFRGIRVRVGLCAVCSSLLESDHEAGDPRVSYYGEAVVMATELAEACQAGMVLIPQLTYRQLHLEYLSQKCLFCHYGEYQLKPDLPVMDMYLAVDKLLLGRLALFGPLRANCQLGQGAFAAPVHRASMVFTHVVGAQTLLSWNYEVMQASLSQFTRLAQAELKAGKGYLVEHVDGFMLTAFYHPLDAVLWALKMQELMVREPWSEDLLAHELCEEVVVSGPNLHTGEVQSSTVFRGPRLRTGIDLGDVLARLHTITGRMTYRGKVMNRAARISAAAASGQVMCSSEAWQLCVSANVAQHSVQASSLGLFQLKGISDKIEIFLASYLNNSHMPTAQTRRSSMVSYGSHAGRQGTGPAHSGSRDLKEAGLSNGSNASVGPAGQARSARRSSTVTHQSDLNNVVDVDPRMSNAAQGERHSGSLGPLPGSNYHYVRYSTELAAPGGLAPCPPESPGLQGAAGISNGPLISLGSVTSGSSNQKQRQTHHVRVGSGRRPSQGSSC